MLAIGLPAAAAATSLGTRTAASVRESTDAPIQALRAQLDTLKRRFEESDEKNKKLLKAALALAALSLGLDVTALI